MKQSRTAGAPSAGRIGPMLSGLLLALPVIDSAAVEEPPPVAAARGPELVLALEAARTAIDACLARGFPVSASVVDSAGVLKVLLAADGAAPRGVQSSTHKAVTAITFKAPTSQLGERTKTAKSFADTVAADPSYNVRAGAVLLVVKGEIIGAIGVGGARPSEIDEACATAGVAQIGDRLK